MKRTTIIPAIAAILALVLAACGGAESTATPVPVPPTPTVLPPAPAATAVAPTPTATARPATPTATRPAPTPTPLTGVPTPIVNRSGKYGGILSLPAIATQPYGYDTYEAGTPSFSYEVWNPMFNNVIWPDPYGDGHTLVGDLAAGWELSEGGQVITISLNKGVKFHDGAPLTSKDVAYNYDRALNPRTPTMTYFKPRLRALTKVEAPDESTVRLTLSRPSNSAMLVLAMNQWGQYPAHLPFPEKLDEFKKNPIGSGPFKLKNLQQDVRLEYVRNASYWKPGLPYVDGIVFTPVSGEGFLAGARSGRFDASTFNGRELAPPSNRTTLNAATGWVSQPIIAGLSYMTLNQRPPWTDRRVREAVSLAVDRGAVVRTWLEGAGSPFASPLLSLEIGGRWGIPEAQMRTRPGFRDDKTEDRARAQKLLTEAGVDLSGLTVKILINTGNAGFGETVEESVRGLGFKTKLDVVPSQEGTARLRAGDFDVSLGPSSPAFDDPSDYLNDFVLTIGGQNWGKWSWPELDRLLEEQDRTQDIAKRKALLLEIQEMMLRESFGAFIPMVFRLTSVGYQPWVKNYYPRLPFTHSPTYRWEQIWLER